MFKKEGLTEKEGERGRALEEGERVGENYTD